MTKRELFLMNLKKLLKTRNLHLPRYLKIVKLSKKKGLKKSPKPSQTWIK